MNGTFESIQILLIVVPYKGVQKCPLLYTLCRKRTLVNPRFFKILWGQVLKQKRKV